MTRPSNLISRRCIGYQIEEGEIRRSVWSGLVLFDDGHAKVQYWLESGGPLTFQDASPRVDRPMAERPR